MLQRINILRERLFSTGALVILAIAVVSSIVVALLPSDEATGIQFWLISKTQRDSYIERIAQWNKQHPEAPFVMSLSSTRATERRILSGFLSGTPVADLMEVHEHIYPKAFLGGLGHIGFLDITDRLHTEGLYEQINEPSFVKVTSRGHIFGIPRDVHPVLLAYRADLVEAAGIDVSQIETWDDYFRVMRPLMEDRNGDGRPDRYLLNLSEHMSSQLCMLLFQNDGVIFDEADMPAFASERNAHTLAKIITWISGPERMTIEVNETTSGYRQQLDGLVVGSLMPDWMLGNWKIENPRLAGKIKLMPLPAFERGGRRTSVWGGAMIGINKRSAHIEACWEMAKYLCTSTEVAEKTWRQANILSPVRALWDEPFYHEPDPFCGGQPVGSLFIKAAPAVPRRSATPYANIAYARIASTAIALRAYAEQHEIYDIERLALEAQRLLQAEQTSLKKLMSRNVFLTKG